MHTKFERLLSKSLTTLEVMTYYLVVHTGPGKDHSKLSGYRTLTMQNTTGELVERIIVRKIAQDLENRNVLPPNRAGGNTYKNAARFAYDVYEGFQRKQQNLAIAVDLEDAYKRVYFKQLVKLLVQYGVSLTLTR